MAQIGIVIDDDDLGKSAEVGKVETYRTDEKYQSRVCIERSTVTKADLLTIEMRAAGGFIGRLA